MLFGKKQWLVISVPWKYQIKCTMLLRDKGLQSSLQKIVTFMFQALVLVHNIVTSVWYIYFCCTALCSLLLSFYSIVTHSKAGNCHFDVSGFYREAKYLHFLPVFDDLIKGLEAIKCNSEAKNRKFGPIFSRIQSYLIFCQLHIFWHFHGTLLMSPLQFKRYYLALAIFPTEIRELKVLPSSEANWIRFLPHPSQRGESSLLFCASVFVWLGSN